MKNKIIMNANSQREEMHSLFSSIITFLNPET